MTIREMLSKFFEKDAEQKEMEKSRKIQRIIEQKEKSANERELERYLEEDRQKMIKEHLDRYRKERQEQFWHGNSNFGKDIKIVQDDRPILKQKNIFTIKQNGFI